MRDRDMGLGPLPTEDVLQCPSCAGHLRELDAEVRRLRTALEEREMDMHARIRGEYDGTIAESWKRHFAPAVAVADICERISQLIRKRNQAERAGSGDHSAVHVVAEANRELDDARVEYEGALEAYRLSKRDGGGK